jgi:hypothetical protein
VYICGLSGICGACNIVGLTRTWAVGERHGQGRV